MILFMTTVKRLEEKSRLVRAWREGDDVRTERESLGWALLLEGSWESLFVGSERPDLEVGDSVVVRIEKVQQSQ